MPKLFRAAAIAASLLFALPGLAQEAEPDRIARMSLPELSSLADTIIGSVGQDVRKLEPAAQRRDCPELTRAFNGFTLAYQMLGHADAALKGRPAREALPVKIKLIQSRVITFASRVRAEEWDDGGNRLPLRTITDLDLSEITLTAFPAYPTTTASLRSTAANNHAQARRRIEAKMRKRGIPLKG